MRRSDPDNPSSIRSLARLAGNPNNKPAASNDHTAQPGTEPALNRFALKPLALGLGLGPQTVGGPDTLSTDSQTIYPSSCTGSTFASCKTQQEMGQSVPPDDIGLQLSSDPSGAPGPWYTGHADYWQTWQQGKPLGPDPNTGTLNSLTYYCLVEAPQPNSCGFQPDPMTGMFPPPPGS